MIPRFALNLGSDILQVLDGLRTATRDWPVVIEHLTGFLDNGATNRDTRRVEERLIAAGLGSDVVRIREWWAQVDDRVKDLLEPIASLESQIVWHMLERDTNVVLVPLPIGSARFKAGLQASAQVERIEADESAAMGIVLLPEHAMLRIGIEGGLHAEMSGSGSSGFLIANLRGKGSAQLDLDYLFSHPRRHFVVQGLADSLPHIPPPYDLEAIAEAREKRLEAITISAEGMADVGLDVSGGQVWGTQFSVDAPGTSSIHTIGLSTGLSAGFTANLRLAGSFNVIVRPTVDGPVFVQLKREVDRNAATTINVGAQVGITGLDGLGLELTRSFLPDAEGLITELGGFLDLGAKLKAVLDDHLDLGGLSAEAVKLLSGGGTAEDLAAEIRSAAEAAANQTVAGLLGEGGSRVGELVSGIAARLGLDAGSSDVLGSIVTPALETAIDAIEQELADLVGTWGGKAESELTSLLSPLEAVGEKVDALVTGLQSDVNTVLVPLLEFLNRYQRIRRKIVTALEGAARVKIGVSLSHALATSRASELMLEMLIDPEDHQASAAYAQLITGSFSRAVELGRAGGQGVTILGGTLEERVSVKQRLDFNLSIGSLSLSTQKLLSHDFAATYDAAGNVVAVRSSTDLRKVVNGWREQREVRFVSAFELADAVATNSLLSAAVTISHRDEELHRRELEQWLGSLEDVGLLAPGATERALVRFDQLGDSANRRFFKAQLAVALPLEPSEFSTLFTFDRETIAARAVVHQLQARFSGEREKGEFIAFMRELGSGSQWIPTVLEVGRRGALAVHGSNPGHPPHLLMIAQFMGKRAIELADTMVEIRNALREPLPKNDGQLRRLHRLNKRLQGAVSSWLPQRGLIGGMLTERLRFETTAFLGLLIELTNGAASPRHLLPVIQWNAGEPNQLDEIIV